jgi:hypothetical protein
LYICINANCFDGWNASILRNLGNRRRRKDTFAADQSVGASKYANNFKRRPEQILKSGCGVGWSTSEEYFQE